MSALLDRSEPVTRSQLIAQLIVHREMRAAELSEQGMHEMAAAFSESTAQLRAQLRAVVRSERP